MLIHFVFLWMSLSNWCQSLLKHWTKPAPPTSIIGIYSDLACSRSDLVVENALLRQQLIVLNHQVKRPQLFNHGGHIVQPDTRLRWFGKVLFT